MKRRTAALLREVLRLIEDDVRATADSVVEIDEREAAHHRLVMMRLDSLVSYITAPDPADHSRRV